MNLFSRWYLWLGAGLILMLLAGWFQFGGLVKAWWLDIRGAREAIATAKGKIDQAERETALSQEAVRNLSRQILGLAREAGAARVKAREAEERARRWEAEVGRLGMRIAELEADRKRLQPVTSLREAREALKHLGY